jgi:hypothetical protein
MNACASHLAEQLDAPPLALAKPAAEPVLLSKAAVGPDGPLAAVTREWWVISALFSLLSALCSLLYALCSLLFPVPSPTSPVGQLAETQTLVVLTAV